MSKVEEETGRLTYGSVWADLSAIDCTEHVQKKMNLSYLSWAWAWGILMDRYPEAYFLWRNTAEAETRSIAASNYSDGVSYHPDGSATVLCEVYIPVLPEHKLNNSSEYRTLCREMWLPVMDHKNNAIKNPDARNISDAKMRCLVKALALFGLGHYIYAGEDLPSEDARTKATKAPSVIITEPEADENHDYVYAQEMVKAVKATANRLDKTGWAPDDQFKRRIRNALSAKKVDTLKAVLDELQTLENTAAKLTTTT